MVIFVRLWFGIVLFFAVHSGLFAQTESTSLPLQIDSLLVNAKKKLTSDAVKATELADNALNASKLIRYSKGIAEASYLLGNLHLNLGDYEYALSYFLKALSIQDSLQDFQKSAATLNDIATLYRHQNNLEKVQEYLNRILEISPKANTPLITALGYQNLARVYLLRKEYKAAEIYYKQTLAIWLETKDTTNLVVGRNNLGLVQARQGRYTEALENYYKSLNMNEKYLKNWDLIAAVCDNIGDVYVKQNKLEDAERYLQRSLSLANKLTAKRRLMESCESFVAFYEAKKDHEKALDWYKRYATLKDSILNSTQSAQIARMNSVYNIEQRNKENEILKKERQFHEEEMLYHKEHTEKQFTIIIAISIALLSVILFTYILYRHNRKEQYANEKLKIMNVEITEQREELLTQTQDLHDANEEIKNLYDGLDKTVQDRTKKLSEALKELDTFLYHTSHDFRRPLTAILGLINLGNMFSHNKELVEVFKHIELTTDEMEKMLGKLKVISEINVSETVPVVIDFEKLLENIKGEFRGLLLQKHITFKYFIVNTSPFFSNLFLLKTMMLNVIENAIYFSSNEDAWINIHVIQQDKTLTITISDNGQGIEDKYLSNIFEMYFRANENSKGNGLGLYLVKKLVNKLNGEVLITSEVQKGTKVEISLKEK